MKGIKIVITLLIIFVIIAGIIMFNNKESSENNIVANEINEISEKVTDECTEEYQEMQEQIQ